MEPKKRHPDFPWGHHGRIRKPKRWGSIGALPAARISPEERRQRSRRLECERIIEAGLRASKVPPLPATRLARGAAHPLPRRGAKDPNEWRDYDAHKKFHQYEYRPGCPKCYSREHMYYQLHPERRPDNLWTAGCGNDALPEKMTRTWPKETDTDGY